MVNIGLTPVSWRCMIKVWASSDCVYPDRVYDSYLLSSSHLVMKWARRVLLTDVQVSERSVGVSSMFPCFTRKLELLPYLSSQESTNVRINVHPTLCPYIVMFLALPL